MTKHTRPYMMVEKRDGVVTVTAVAATRNGHRRMGSIQVPLSDRPALKEQALLLITQVRSLQQGQELQADG